MFFFFYFHEEVPYQSAATVHITMLCLMKLCSLVRTNHSQRLTNPILIDIPKRDIMTTVRSFTLLTNTLLIALCWRFYICVFSGMGKIIKYALVQPMTKWTGMNPATRFPRWTAHCRGKYYFLLFKWNCWWIHCGMIVSAGLDTPIPTQWSIFDRLLPVMWPFVWCELGLYVREEQFIWAKGDHPWLQLPLTFQSKAHVLRSSFSTSCYANQFLNGSKPINDIEGTVPGTQWNWIAQIFL